MNPDNENLEKALRGALRRTPAPPDFAAKVLAKTGVETSLDTARTSACATAPKFWQRRSFTMAFAAGLAVIAIVPTVILEHERQEARGLKAKQDLLTALAITRDQLQQAREKVRHTTRNIQ